MPVEAPARPPAAEAVATPALPPPVAAAPVLAPPETPVAAPASKRPNLWWGWAAAAGLAAVGIVFYLLAYAPLRGDLVRLEQTNATLREQHEATQAKLRAEIAASQSRAAQVESDATASAAQAPAVLAAPPHGHELARPSAATKPSATEKHPGAEPKPAAAGPKPALADSKPASAEAKRDAAASKPAEHDAHAVTKTKGVDRAAASAATAALEAEAYGKSPVTAEPAQAAAREPMASAPKEAPAAKPTGSTGPEKKDGLGEIERESSDDPLEGL